jgi:hypothetical protein
VALAPGLEHLEGRRLMTAGAARVRIREIVSDGTVELRVVGTNRDDVVRIDDNGSGQAGNVTVTLGDGRSYTSKKAISGIQVAGKKGNDQVTYNLTGDLVSARTVVATLGAGNDQFTASVDHAVQTTQMLDLEAFGEAGNDILAIRQAGPVTAGTVFPYLQGDAGDDTLSYTAVGDIGAGATVGPGLVGGDGNDTIALGFSGNVDGQLLYNSTIDGGPGDDSLGAQVAVGADSTGKVGTDSATTAVVQGGDGDDQIRFAVAVDPSATGVKVFGTAVGGAGTDTARRTSNVQGDPSTENDAILS